MAKRVDANQPDIVRDLRKVGATVQHLHEVGKGCPDIAVGFRGVNHFMEIKDGSKPPSARKLTSQEADWHQKWEGQVTIVKNTAEALKAIGIEHKGTINSADRKMGDAR